MEIRIDLVDYSKGMRVRWRRWAVLALVALMVAGAWGPAFRHLRAAALLARFVSDAPGRLGQFEAFAVDETRTSFRAGAVDVPARRYQPRGLPTASGLVLVHGVHHLGIEEPRLVRFARTIASAGVVVFTPEVQQLADYRVDAKSVDTIGEAVDALSHALGEAGKPSPRVGLMGLSFAGGLALITAADPRYAPEVGFVVAVGAHDDLSRVSRFFALDEIQRPDGTTAHSKAHEYGPLVLVYAHVADFFAGEDLEVARDALRLWLWEERDAARKRAGDLSPTGRARMDLLFEDSLQTLAPELLACIARDGAVMAAVSPAGHLGGLQAHALLLHGAGDSVIPPSETLWLAKDVPAAQLRDVLISPALQHVELEGQPDWKDQWALVHFMADVLAETDSLRAAQ